MRVIAFTRCLFAAAALLTAVPAVHAQEKKTSIKLKHADKLKGDKTKEFQRLLGNVEFEHQGAIMKCDSAHLYEKTNSMEAYGRVHIQHGDSIHLYGDLLKYNGNERKAELFKNISMTDGDMRLVTDYLIYDLKNKVASYTTGGKIFNRENTLESKLGYYSTEGKVLTFRKDVKLFNPQYTMNCDTLKYLPVSKVAYFVGPTTIFSKANGIYCEDGWYDTQTDKSRFSKNAYILFEKRKLTGDSLFYDRKSGIGRALKNVVLLDTTQKIIIKGDLAMHYEKTELSLVTGKAEFIQIFDEDSLYLHADTLKSTTRYDTLVVPGSKTGYQIDTSRTVYAYHGVKFFKKDMQGKCDSLVYAATDSTMRLFGLPVMWSDQNQLSADSITLFTSNGNISSMLMESNAFISSQEDTVRFNQIKGRRMRGFFKDNDLYRIEVEGNGQTLYYVRDKNMLVGVNKADSPRLAIFIAENSVKSITFFSKPEATLYPLFDLPPREALLKDFKWRIGERPLKREDIFVQ